MRRCRADLCYSDIGLRELWAPRNARIDSLRWKLEQHKAVLSQAFLLEIKKDTSGIRDTFHNMWMRETTEKEQFLLEKLIPPNECLFWGKSSCLPGTRTSVLNEIRAWVQDTTKPSRLFWLHGVAGVEKAL